MVYFELHELKLSIRALEEVYTNLKDGKNECYKKNCERFWKIFKFLHSRKNYKQRKKTRQQRSGELFGYLEIIQIRWWRVGEAEAA